MNKGKLVFAQLTEHLPLSKSQIWIAVSVYVLVAIVKKRLNLEASLFQLLQILSVTMFERTPLHQLLTVKRVDPLMSISDNQLNLSEF